MRSGLDAVLTSEVIFAALLVITATFAFIVIITVISNQVSQPASPASSSAAIKRPSSSSSSSSSKSPSSSRSQSPVAAPVVVPTKKTKHHAAISAAATAAIAAVNANDAAAAAAIATAKKAERDNAAAAAVAAVAVKEKSREDKKRSKSSPAPVPKASPAPTPAPPVEPKPSVAPKSDDRSSKDKKDRPRSSSSSSSKAIEPAVAEKKPAKVAAPTEEKKKGDWFDKVKKEKEEKEKASKAATAKGTVASPTIKSDVKIPKKCFTNGDSPSAKSSSSNSSASTTEIVLSDVEIVMEGGGVVATPIKRQAELQLPEGSGGGGQQAKKLKENLRAVLKSKLRVRCKCLKNMDTYHQDEDEDLKCATCLKGGTMVGIVCRSHASPIFVCARCKDIFACNIPWCLAVMAKNNYLTTSNLIQIEANPGIFSGTRAEIIKKIHNIEPPLCLSVAEEAFKLVDAPEYIKVLNMAASDAKIRKAAVMSAISVCNKAATRAIDALDAAKTRHADPSIEPFVARGAGAGDA